MSKAPAMPVFTDALIGDTTHLSAEEFGAYCLILFATWRNNGNPFPDDDRRLSRICRVTETRWRARLRPALVGFFDLSRKTWWQKRLEKEWNRVAEMIAIQSKKGKLSGEARRLKSQETTRTEVPFGFEPNSEPNANNQTHKEDSVGSNEPTAAVSAAQPELVIVAGTDFMNEPDLRATVFDVGKRIAGKSAGGMIRQLIDRHAGDLRQTLDTLSLAQRKQKPREYLARIAYGQIEPETDWDAVYRRMGLPEDEFRAAH